MYLNYLVEWTILEFNLFNNVIELSTIISSVYAGNRRIWDGGLDVVIIGGVIVILGGLLVSCLMRVSLTG